MCSTGDWQRAIDVVRAAGLEAPARFLEEYQPRPPYWRPGCRCTVTAEGLTTHDCPLHT